MAKYWMHNGLMQASNEVGKVGGRATPGRRRRSARAGSRQDQQDRRAPRRSRELLERVPAETIRFFLLSTHYRRPIDFSEERHRGGRHRPGDVLPVLQAVRAHHRRELLQVDCAARRARRASSIRPATPRSWRSPSTARRFLEAMDDDFNTGGAMADLFELMRTLNKYVDDQKLEASKPSDAQAGRAAAGRQDAARAGRHAGPVPHSRRARRPAGGDDELVGKLMKLLIELRAAARRQEGLRHGRSHSQRADRNRHHAGGSSRRHRVDREMQRGRKPRHGATASSASIPG